MVLIKRSMFITCIAAGAMFAGGCASSDMAASKGDADAGFLTETAHSSYSELELSRLAEKQASDPQVKAYAAMMVRDHSVQNSSLADLAQSKGVTPPTRPDELHAKCAAMLKNLDAKQFDAEYMSGMVADHARLLSKMQDKAASPMSDPQVKSWAAQQVPILQAHLDQARAINTRLGGASTLTAGGAGGSAGAGMGSGMGGMHSGMSGSTSGSMGGRSGGMSR